MPKGKSYRGSERRMIMNVYNYMKQEAEHGVNYKTILERVADACQVSQGTIHKLITETEYSDTSAFPKPSDKNGKQEKPVAEIDGKEIAAIKTKLHRFHIESGELPTLSKLLKELLDDLCFEGSEQSLRKVLSGLGFKCRKTKNGRRVLVESMNLRLKRIEYIAKLNQYRTESRSIVYTGETDICSTQIKQKPNSDGSSKSLKRPISKSQKLIIVYAGSETGCIPNALYMLKSGSKPGDIHSDLDYAKYEKWLRKKLIPNLKPNSVVIVNNAPYHNKLSEAVPNSNSKLSCMHKWLQAHNIAFTPDMYKPELYELIRMHKDIEKRFAIDRVLETHGHTIMRLPPHHSDLNPIQLLFMEIKDYLNHMFVEWNTDNIIELVKEKIKEMGASDMSRLCQDVIDAEFKYMQSDEAVDQLTDIDPIVISTSADSSDSEDMWESDAEDSEVPDLTVKVEMDDKCEENDSSELCFEIPIIKQEVADATEMSSDPLACQDMTVKIEPADT